MRNRSDIKKQAKSKFHDLYGINVGAYLLYFLIAAAASGITLGLGFFFIMPPITVGYSLFALRVYKDGQVDIGSMFNRAFDDYWRNVGGILWMELFTFLWSLLFIIPGIIKRLAYFMTPYILADSKNVKPTEAIKLSMRMTKGYKGEIFVMFLSFIGWIILSALTFGVLQILYSGPYMSVSLAGLYHELRQNAIEKGVVTEAELA
ncbi:MAG: hypothetical protein BWY11_01025 [Firmicutes bacterium ADurb.Bin182]|nr:MAG: hypothetical protein BWY11_01025 [Firmicutes bacterium ADurb.Bin182]